MPFAGNVGRLLLSALSALVLVTASQAQDLSHDQAAIKGLMRKTWERPSAPLSVDPVVVVDDHAIAGWIQDDRGGEPCCAGSMGLGMSSCAAEISCACRIP